MPLISAMKIMMVFMVRMIAAVMMTTTILLLLMVMLMMSLFAPLPSLHKKHYDSIVRVRDKARLRKGSPHRPFLS